MPLSISSTRRGTVGGCAPPEEFVVRDDISFVEPWVAGVRRDRVVTPGPPPSLRVVEPREEAHLVLRRVAVGHRDGLAGRTALLEARIPALPNPDTAASKPSKKTAKKLGRFGKKANAKVEKCTGADVKKQGALCQKARGALNKLLTNAQKADSKGTLGVPLPPIEDAIDGILGSLPA